MCDPRFVPCVPSMAGAAFCDPGCCLPFGPKPSQQMCDPCAPCLPCGPYPSFPCDPCMPYGTCAPFDPRCGPCGPCGPCYPECGPKTYSGKELRALPQCPGMVPPQRSGPRFITVQAPPKLVSKKNIVYCDRTIVDRHLVPQTRAIYDAKVINNRKTLCYPCVVYKKYTIPEPKVVWERKELSDPKVVCQQRVVTEPREICTPLMCQPRPQRIEIPPAMDYVCSPAGTTYLKTNCWMPPRC